MGACCGCGGSEYPEIEDASTMAEISNFLKEKRNLLPIEAKEIEEYIKDNKKIPKHVDVGYQKDSNLIQRISYLERYGNVIDEVCAIMDEHQNMNLKQVKPIIVELYRLYYNTYDPENKCSTIPDKLPCCGGSYYPEIEESSTIEELSNCLKERRKDFPIEAKEVTEYLSDPSKIPRKLNVSEIPKESLRERVSYLQKYGQVFDEVCDILDNHKNININDVKPIMAELYSCYFKNSDSDNRLGSIPNQLRNLIK